MTRRLHRFDLVRLAAACLALASSQVEAQEPLFLRIRPSDSPREIGAGGSDAEIARAARGAREAVWERSAVRARIAIASVCTGCLGPVRAALPLRPARPTPPPDDALAAFVPAEPSPDGAAAPSPSTRGDP